MRDIRPTTWVGLSVAGLTVVALVYVLLWAPGPPAAPQGAPPMTTDDEVHLVAEGRPLTVDVVGNDTDPDEDLDPLTVTISESPDEGTTSINLDGTIEYTPGPDFDGEDVFGYRVCDSTALCESAQVTVLARVVAMSGDSVRFAVFGDYGDGLAPGAAAVSQLVSRLQLDFIVTTGDNSYDNADYEANVGQFYSGFIGNYTGTHGPGSPVNRFFPSLGDHEYTDGGVDAYLEYFTLPGEGVPSTNTSGNERYYDIVMGPVHVFLLNVQPQEPDGSSQFSDQAAWLQAQLALSNSPWRLVVSPIPPFSSGDNHGSDPIVQWPYGVWGADAVFSGDDHIYERIHREGVDYFVSGLGGRSMYGFDVPVEGSEVRYNEDFGVLVVEACDEGMTFSFQTVSKGVVDQFVAGSECGSGGADLG